VRTLSIPFTEHDERCDGLAGGYHRHAFEVASQHTDYVHEFLLVSLLDQSFGGVAEGPVPDIVQKCCEAGGVAILSGHFGYVLVTIVAETPSMIGVPFERPNHALSGFYDTLYVLEPVMTGSRKDEVSHPELAHAS